MIKEIRKEIHRIADPKKAKLLQGFFKTGPGQYGQGDIFVGIMVPQSRMLAKKYADTSMADIQELLDSKVHEERLIALLILVERYKRDPEAIASFYLKNLGRVNNWDLVDLTAPKILGPFVEKGDRSLLYKLAKSPVLWERRVAILATFHLIRKRDFSDALQIAEILLCDEHDLMHKAVGWMLREIGKLDEQKEEEFLKKHCKNMPRTMLRYAVERFPERKRRIYLDGVV